MIDFSAITSAISGRILGTLRHRLVLTFTIFCLAGAFGMAQSNISGDLVGTVTDPTGAAVVGATVTVVNTSTGETKTATTGASGNYRVSLLPPSTYKITITATGFDTARQQIATAAGTTATANAKLKIGQTSTVIDVSAENMPLLHTEDAQISTTFNLSEIQALPNPGNDLTFIAQTSPGAVMNTQGGYGNFSVFGLPATSNTFTVNGGYENDPFLNLNNSGATNLLLGNNDISDVTVTSNAYDAAFGGLGGAQVNQISRSGANGFHGNATYWWNGRAMNANNWFNKNAPAGQQTPRPFDNVNQYAAAIGGPIVRDRAFFFANYEGLRVILPTRGTVYAPSAAYQATILGQIPTAEVPLYTRMFQQYNALKGFANAPVDADDPNVVDVNAVASNFTHEYLVSGRVDDKLGEHDQAFVHFKVDKGVQATFTSLLNPLFNVLSPQPQYEGQFNETHIISPSIANQFLFAASYYRAVFTNTQQTQANDIAPFALVFLSGGLGKNGFGGYIGGEDHVFPQGRNVTGYQFNDDLSWTRGNHTLKFGFQMRRDDVTDYSPSIRAVTQEAYATNADFARGYASRYRQTFPTRLTQPVALYTMGFYVQDQWRARPNLTVTAGLRLEHNSNPICLTNCYANFVSDFSTLAANTNGDTPYNQQIKAGQYNAFSNLQKIAYEPRVGLAWLPFGPNSRTTVRGGFGIFADSFPGQIADSLLSNAPNDIEFYLRPTGGFLLDPTLPGSGGAATTASNQAFTSGYASGGSYNSLSAAVPGFGAPAFTDAQRSIKYPTYEEYSLAVEHEIMRNTVLSVSYVGNHGYHEPVLNSAVNAYQGVYSGAAIPDGTVFGANSLPANAPSQAFGTVTEFQTPGTSNYNGLITSVSRRGGVISYQFNYAWSHSLDEVSNGGFNPFSANPIAPANPTNIKQSYGNSDYDVRHYISANYILNIPHYHGPKVLVDGWQISGTIFHSTGLPFSVIDSNAPEGNFGGSVLAMQTGNSFDHHCGGAAHAGQNGTPCAFSNFFADPTETGQQERNQLTGSGYTDTDLDLLKSFEIPRWESARLKIGAQVFNVLNHPNFGQPTNDFASGLGSINSTVNTPTSILGSFLGGDASPRLVQLKASFSF